MDRRKQEQISKLRAKMLSDSNEYQKLLHKVFVENKDGEALLGIWLDATLITEGHSYGKDAYDLGRIEGRKEFVREIMIQSKQAEER